ncbi:GIY-YIG nuclease family protein [Caproiciproducens sp. MSJ-32]|uniref:GIY-YIG nuclease family protein n=1 Tax=Caproiciproducens sp. MSJ-32 TaxID=2841527 RepID=UPI001C11AD0D|nr:GIY-YIG nuclease family protein [Caproiciproducens sp. MSJ-32]MBU5454912.1 GIY-YIG nuclease family protein [Caproiciproducens sp. MSJ-32]
MNYVYMLECSDGSLYTGWTNNLEKRIAAHNNGKGAKYTRVRLPVKLVYYEEYEDKIEAMKREYEIKRLSRKEKVKLIKSEEYQAMLKKMARLEEENEILNYFTNTE